eukprot:6790124-Prymnesium_polylepis.1
MGVSPPIGLTNHGGVQALARPTMCAMRWIAYLCLPEGYEVDPTMADIRLGFAAWPLWSAAAVP